jgi:hypothetical protein
MNSTNPYNSCIRINGKVIADFSRMEDIADDDLKTFILEWTGNSDYITVFTSGST